MRDTGSKPTLKPGRGGGYRQRDRRRRSRSRSRSRSRERGRYYRDRSRDRYDSDSDRDYKRRRDRSPEYGGGYRPDKTSRTEAVNGAEEAKPRNGLDAQGRNGQNEDTVNSSQNFDTIPRATPRDGQMNSQPDYHSGGVFKNTCTVTIRGIPEGVTEDNILDAIGLWADVQGFKMVQNRGTCYIRLASVEQTRACVYRSQSLYLGGKRLRCDPVENMPMLGHPYKPNMAQKPLECRTLFIGNLPDGYSEIPIRNALYEGFGETSGLLSISVRIAANGIPPLNAFAHVKFDTTEACERAALYLAGKVVNGIKLKVDWAVEKHSANTSRQPTPVPTPHTRHALYPGDTGAAPGGLLRSPLLSGMNGQMPGHTDVHVMSLEQSLDACAGRMAKVTYDVPPEYQADQLSWDEYYGPVSRFRAFLLHDLSKDPISHSIDGQIHENIQANAPE